MAPTQSKASRLRANFLIRKVKRGSKKLLPLFRFPQLGEFLSPRGASPMPSTLVFFLAVSAEAARFFLNISNATPDGTGICLAAQAEPGNEEKNSNTNP